MPVSLTVELYWQSHNVDKVARLLSHLSLEQVRDALAYYALYPERVDEDILTNQQATAEFRGQQRRA